MAATDVQSATIPVRAATTHTASTAGATASTSGFAAPITTPATVASSSHADTTSECVYGDTDGDTQCNDVDSCPLDASNDADSDLLCADADSCPSSDVNDADSDSTCDDTSPSKCIPALGGNGACDAKVAPTQNTERCGWDGGDCCEATCVSTAEHQCGEQGFACLFDDSAGVSDDGDAASEGEQQWLIVIVAACTVVVVVSAVVGAVFVVRRQRAAPQALVSPVTAGRRAVTVPVRQSALVPALVKACETGSEMEVLDLILNGTANAAAVDMNGVSPSGQTPLAVACRRNHKPIVDMLLNHKADPDRFNSDGTWPLYEVARKGHSPLLAALLNAGASTNQTDDEGYSALHVACRVHKTEIVELLLASGANPKLPTHSGVTPLILASSDTSDWRSVSYLLAAKADPEARGGDGSTALTVACSLGLRTHAMLLARSRASLDVRSPAGLSLEHLAREHGSDAALANWLRAARKFNDVHWACETCDAAELRRLLRSNDVTLDMISKRILFNLTPRKIARRHKRHADLLPSCDVAPTKAARKEVRQLISWALQPWTTLTHAVWPASFRYHVVVVLCLAQRLDDMHPGRAPIPSTLWWEILSFCDRDDWRVVPLE